MSETSNQIEALLFSSGKAMSVEDIANLINIEKKEVKKALKELKEKYDSADSSLMVTQEGDFWKLNIREKFASLVTKIIADTEMNTAVLETLSVIAWKSPVLQSDVVKIRTSNAYEHIKELVEAGFINKEREGRSYKLKIAEKFFEYFDVPGDKGIKEAFKEVKIPEKKEPEHLGKLEVVQIAETDEESKEEKPQIDIPPIDNDFLDKVDKQITDVSERNDELEKDELFKRKQDNGEFEDDTDKVSDDSEEKVEVETEEAESESSSEDVEEDVREELSEILAETEDETAESEQSESESSEVRSETKQTEQPKDNDDVNEEESKEPDDKLKDDESTEDLEKLDEELDDNLKKLKEAEEAEDTEESDDKSEDEEEKKKEDAFS